MTTTTTAASHCEDRGPEGLYRGASDGSNYPRDPTWNWPATSPSRTLPSCTGSCSAHQCEPATALVAENDPWIRLVLRDLLAQAGYRVVEASNGFSALRLAEREPLALVVLDLVPPERSGPSALSELRAAPTTARVPVIVISADPLLPRDAVAQADAIIKKPFATDTFQAEVRRRRQPAELLTDASLCATQPADFVRRANCQEMLTVSQWVAGKYW